MPDLCGHSTGGSHFMRAILFYARGGRSDDANFVSPQNKVSPIHTLRKCKSDKLTAAGKGSPPWLAVGPIVPFFFVSHAQ